MSEMKTVSYEDRVIEAAREGYATAFVQMDDTLEKLLRLVYQAGVKQGQLQEMEKSINARKN